MHRRFSQDTQSLLGVLRDRPLTLGDILVCTAERGFGLMIGLFVMPFLLPMPPGLSTILGLVCLLLSGQMMLGQSHPWLPRPMAKVRFPEALAGQILQKLHRLTIRLEQLAKPRWGRLANHTHTQRINGLCLAWLTLLLMAPIPFTNPIPATVIILLIIGILESDGLLMGISYFITGLLTTGLGAMGYLLWRSSDWFSQMLPHFSP